MGVTEVHGEAGVDAELGVLGHFGALVLGQRSAQLLGQRHNRHGDGVADGSGAVAGESGAVVHSGRLWFTHRPRRASSAVTSGDP